MEKSKLFWMYAILLLAVGLSSCSKDDDLSPVVGKAYMMSPMGASWYDGPGYFFRELKATE